MVKYLLDSAALALASPIKVTMTTAQKGYLKQVAYLIKLGANDGFSLGGAHLVPFVEDIMASSLAQGQRPQGQRERPAIEAV